MVHLRESQILEGHVLQPLDRFLGRKHARLQGFQHFQQFRLIHIVWPPQILSSHKQAPSA